MKTNKLFKTALLLLLAVAGTNTAWADEVAVTVNNDSELKTAYETAYNSEVAGTTVITMNAGTYTCEGMSYKQLQMPKVRSVTLQAAEGAKVTLTTKVVSDGGGTPTGSLTFKGIFLISSDDTFINITSCGNVDHISFIDCDITAIESTHRFLIKNGNASYTLNTISFNGCIIHDMGNGYYLIDPTHKVQNVSFTNSTIYNYNGDQLFHPETASDDVFSFIFNNNTVYKCGSNSRTGMLYVDNKYNNASNTFTFKDNIFWDKYGTGEAYVFYSKTGAGTVIQKNNALHTYTAEWNTGSYTKDYANLDYTGEIPFYDAENHNFGIHPSHALATASTTGGVVGDPRWLIVSMNEENTYTPTEKKHAVVELTRSIPEAKWATLCLPFSMDNATLKATYGDDVKIANFTAYNSSTKALTFTQMLDGTDAITANTPCLIKVTTAVSTAKNINGVTIVEGTPEVTFSPAVFRGVYSSTEMAPGDYFVSGGNLYKASSSTKNIKPFRAYFTGVPNEARMAVDDGFGDVTYIDMPHVNGSAADGKCYNLQGQRVEQPTKGLYIVNGKKVVIK